VKYLREICGDDAPHQQVTTEQLQDWINTRLSEGYEPGTLQGYRQHMNKFFEWLGGFNPTEGLEIPKAPKQDKPAWTSETDRAAIRRAAREIDAEAVDGLPSRVHLVELLFATGVRIQEGAAARWEWIDPQTRTMRVHGQISRSGEFKPAKGKKPRTVVVLPTWWPHHHADRIGLILSMEDGTPVPYRKLSEMVSEVLERAGLKVPGECAHAFRHTYAFLMLERGVSMMDLQKCLGHKNIKTTQDYYDHWSPGHAARSGAEAVYGRR
jgi:integrase